MTPHFDLNKATQLLQEDTNPSYMYNKRELKNFYEWFMANKENHLEIFSDIINRLAGRDIWKNDYTPASLIVLAQILYPLIEGQFISDVEYQNQLNNASQIVREYIYNFELTHNEKILAFLGAVYLGEVLIRNNQDYNLQWELCRLPKNYVFSGHMVIPLTEFTQACPILTFYPFIHGCLRHRYNNEPQNNYYLYNYFLKITSFLHDNVNK